VPFIITLRINPIQMPHGSGNICIRGLDQEMIMGRHKTISRDLNLENLVKFLKEINKRPIVVLCCENIFPTQPTIHHVISTQPEIVWYNNQAKSIWNSTPTFRKIYSTELTKFSYEMYAEIGNQ
jgi:hypothetical protein